MVRGEVGGLVNDEDVVDDEVGSGGGLVRMGNGGYTAVMLHPKTDEIVVSSR